MGEKQGHPFRGNQHGKGKGGGSYTGSSGSGAYTDSKRDRAILKKQVLAKIAEDDAAYKRLKAKEAEERKLKPVSLEDQAKLHPNMPLTLESEQRAETYKVGGETRSIDSLRRKQASEKRALEAQAKRATLHPPRKPGETPAQEVARVTKQWDKEDQQAKAKIDARWKAGGGGYAPGQERGVKNVSTLLKQQGITPAVGATQLVARARVEKLLYEGRSKGWKAKHAEILDQRKATRAWKVEHNRRLAKRRAG